MQILLFFEILLFYHYHIMYYNIHLLNKLEGNIGLNPKTYIQLFDKYLELNNYTKHIQENDDKKKYEDVELSELFVPYNEIIH